VDMESEELERLPPKRTVRLLSVGVELVRGANAEALAAKLIQHLKGGRAA